MNITPDTRIQVRKSQSSSVLGTETIVLNYDLGNYYELNEMGSYIWSLLRADESTSATAIKDLVSLFTLSEALGLILFQRGYFCCTRAPFGLAAEAWYFWVNPVPVNPPRLPPAPRKDIPSSATT